MTAYELLNHKNIITIQQAEHYEPDSISRLQLLEEIKKNEDNLNVIISIFNVDSLGSNFLDFGPGRGCSSIAASSLFKNVFSLDLHQQPMKNTLKLLNPINNIFLLNSIDQANVPIDFFYAWHSIEHLPNAFIFFEKIKKYLSSEALIAIQMPLFRPEYVIDSHYLFPNITTIEKLSGIWGFNCHKILIDYTNSFITALLKN
jgi:2-polyprenyl-3-methyl-5-hydroxy-6-metoxy-1,4-benzoquinol methylase